MTWDKIGSQAIKAFSYGAATGYTAMTVLMGAAAFWAKNVKGSGKAHEYIACATPVFRRQVMVGLAVGLCVQKAMSELLKDGGDLPSKRRLNDKLIYDTARFAINASTVMLGALAWSKASNNKGNFYIAAKWAAGLSTLFTLVAYIKECRKMDNYDSI